MELLINNIEEERAVLGCVLQEPSCLDDVTKAIGSDAFFELRHMNLYEIMVDMADSGRVIDKLSILSRAEEIHGSKEAVGGIAYLADLENTVASAAHLPEALRVLSNKVQLRRIQKGSYELQNILGETGGGDEEKLEKLGSTLTGLLHVGRGGEVSTKDIAQETLRIIEQAHAHTGECTGLATGFSAFDRLTTGLHGGEYLILAARPSMGKTSLAMCIAQNLAVEQGIPVGVMSLEMKSTALMLRTFSSMAEIDGRNLRNGQLSERDLKKLTVAYSKVANSGIHIDDASGIGISEASARIRQLVNKYGCKLIVVDYLQLIHGRAEKREREVAEVSAQLKSLSIQLDVPILALSQLSRANDQQARSPRLSDLRDSGSLEQDADLVAFLYREDAESDLTQLNIAKNRNGPCAIVDLEFQPQYTRYVNPRVDAPYIDAERPKHPDFELSHA